MIESLEIDTNVWEIVKLYGTTTSNGEVPNFSIRIHLKHRNDVAYRQAGEALIDKMKAFAPNYPIISPKTSTGDHMLVPSIYDAHFNRRGIDGSGLYNAEGEFHRVVDRLAERSISLGMKVDRVLIPVGNDVFNTDNLAGTTTRGTPQQNDKDIRDAIGVVTDCFVYMIDLFSQIAPVDVVMVEGNHDRLNSYWLGKYLQAWYSKHPTVRVNVTNSPRHYYMYGDTMICMEHGDLIKPKDIASVMAVEQPAMWGKSTFRESWRGHFHQHREMYNAVTEEHGVMVRMMPAMCSTDEWHNLMGYIGANRAAEALFYHRHHGFAGNFPVYIDRE